MEETYKSLKEMLEEEIKKIVKKGTIASNDLQCLESATEILKNTEKLMHNGEYSEGVRYHVPEYSYAYAPYIYAQNRSPVTGRYISGNHEMYDDMSYGNNNSSYGNGNNQNMATMNNRYSGHSIKDRMVARLEPMYDEASSEYERQLIMNTINRIQSEK